MYERFRDRHPDVTLVLLPADDVGSDPAGAVEASPPDPDLAAHDLEQARDDVGSLLTDVCALLEVEARIEVDWRSGSRAGAVQATATAHGPLPGLPAEIPSTLRSAGWHARLTSSSPVPCVDARLAGHALRIVVHRGRAVLTLRGDDVVVGRARSRALVAPERISRG
ncbi:hypothetical protein SERN_0743 [Serinibacter arcticus]|uniref:Uncharacterized protein n=2 Tax=Serinibacter arcticus TaxID=1655435 RepID=A0A4Z1EAV1_9MICO|nr:hypothetical protein SERN_0743 [Serinibacter arcticus]